MKLDPAQLVYGVLPKILVDCAQELHGESEFDLEAFCQALGAPSWESTSVLLCMVRDGFVTRKGGIYKPTTKFNQLALASLSAGISRDQADKLLAAVLQQAGRINSDPETHRCTVECIVVFGSYLTDAQVLGDLDLGVSIKEHPPRSRDEATREYQNMIEGRRGHTAKAMSLLKLRKPKLISLHKMSEVVALGTPYEIVFGAMSASVVD